MSGRVPCEPVAGHSVGSLQQQFSVARAGCSTYRCHAQRRAQPGQHRGSDPLRLYRRLLYPLRGPLRGCLYGCYSTYMHFHRTGEYMYYVFVSPGVVFSCSIALVVTKVGLMFVTRY